MSRETRAALAGIGVIAFCALIVLIASNPGFIERLAGLLGYWRHL